MLVAQAMFRGVLSAAEITLRRNPTDDAAADLVKRLRHIDRMAAAGECDWREALVFAEAEATRDPLEDRYAITAAGEAALGELHLDAVRAFTRVHQTTADYVCEVCDEPVWGDGVCAAPSASTPGCPAITWRRRRHRELTAQPAVA